MYRYHTTIKLHETDAAGLMFFSHQLRMMHDAYEAMLNEMGFGFGTVLNEKDYFIVIAHAEADYSKPVFVGDRIMIEVSLDKVGKSSFALFCRLLDENGGVVGSGKTVHVSVDHESKQPIPLPTELHEAISRI